MNEREKLKQLKDFSNYGLKVLYVEDDQIIRDQTKSILQMIFSNIIIANDGLDGLNKFKENSDINLVLTDINMPNLNGLDMLDEIKKLNSDISCVIFSAHNDSAFLSNSIKVGVDGYLIKPIKFKEYMSLLIKVTDQIRLQYENKKYKEELEEKVQERTQELRDKLYKDDLTNVYSRYALIDDISNREADDIPNLFILNIDSFSLYNELYGIEVGNLILIKFADMLCSFNHDNDYKIYRVAGDEFALYKNTKFISFNQNEQYIKDLIHLVKTTKIYIQNIDIELSITIGISFDTENPLETANMALADAKKQNKSFTTYNTQVDTKEKLKNTLYWKQEIKAALEEDRVVPYFQPIVNRNQEIIKYETLMRISQKDGNRINIVSPGHFVDIAIKTKQYPKLSYYLIKKAINMMVEQNVSLSVNVSFDDIYNKTFMDMLYNSILEFNKYNKDQNKPHKIVLEILESDEIDDYDLFVEQLTRFKNIGAVVAIDDYGSGYSNLSQIVGLSPDYIKIDGTLIEGILSDTKSYQIVKSVIEFAKSLDIKTIAEYVSSKEIFDVLYDLGIDEFQGYYFGKPQDFADISRETDT
jgi:diguanylate cyclase (GGDEF)-like protein